MDWDWDDGYDNNRFNCISGTFILIAIIGRLTDKYGRKKYLPISIVITSIVFALVPFIQGGWNITPGGSGDVNKFLLFTVLPFVVYGLLGINHSNECLESRFATRRQ